MEIHTNLAASVNSEVGGVIFIVAEYEYGRNTHEIECRTQKFQRQKSSKHPLIGTIHGDDTCDVYREVWSYDSIPL